MFLLGLLVGAAYLLERRAEARGASITGDRRRAPAGSQLRSYLSLLVLLASLVLGSWAIPFESWLLLTVASIPLFLVIAARYYWDQRWLASTARRDGHEDQGSQCTDPPDRH